MWPVIVRELRAEARRPANYWLRVAGAAGGMLAAGIYLPPTLVAWFERAAEFLG